MTCRFPSEHGCWLHARSVARRARARHEPKRPGWRAAQHDALALWLCMLLVFVPTWIYYEAAPVGAAALLYLLPLYSAVLVFRRRDSARRAGPPAVIITGTT